MGYVGHFVPTAERVDKMNDDFEWTVRPNEGLLPVKFGDSPDQVGLLPNLSAVTRTMPSADGVLTEMRALDTPAISYKDGRVFYIAVGRRTSHVGFGTLDVFQSTVVEVLQAFEEAQGTPAFVQLGRIVFETLNISIEGFYDEEADAVFKAGGTQQDDRTLIMHAPGTLQVFDGLPKTPVSFIQK